MKISRKDFLTNSALGFAGMTLSQGRVFADHREDNLMNNSNKRCGFSKNIKLKNVRLEIGFDYLEEEVVATKTDLFTVEIENGKIKSVLPNSADPDAIDAKGFLMLPGFKDMHIHLDKTYYGDKWQAVRPRADGVKGMIALEQQIIPELLKTSTSKAEKLIELLQSKGSLFARSHVNVEPTSKLNSLAHLQKALDNKKDGFGAEIVAFPQHGVYYTDTVPYLKEAATMDIDFIGGLDPFSIDGAIEKPIDFTVQLALDNQKGIDIHLHETGESGIKTIEYLIQKVNENPLLKGKTYLSHCFALGRTDKKNQEELAENLADAKIGVVSTVPFGGLIMPIPTLLEKQVEVLVGNDSIIDHWSTFGSGSVLQKANVAAQLYGYSTEYALSRTLKLATGGTIPLDDDGQQVWPKIGDEASFVLLDASCSAEAVARISPVKSLVFNGHLVY